MLSFLFHQLTYIYLFNTLKLTLDNDNNFKSVNPNILAVLGLSFVSAISPKIVPEYF